MSANTPTTSELSASIIAQLESNLEQTIPLMPKAFLRVIAKVLAAAVVIAYKFCGFSLLQQFIRYATMEETTVNGTTFRPLLELGRERGVTDPRDAIRAELVIDVTVNTMTGYLTAGQQLLRKDTGVIYTVVADTALDAATISATIRAASQQGGGDGAGEIGNLSVGDEVEFANTPANVATVATVASIGVVGAEAETTEEYRARVLSRTQSAPQGGAYADYREWAGSANGVKSVYPYTGNPGYVDVYIEATTTVDADGIPTSGVLAAALAAINLDDDGFATRRPANDNVNMLPISRTAYDVEIAGLYAEVDLAPIQDAISVGVDEYLRSREPYIDGLSVLPRLDRITQGEIAGVVAEIANSYGATVNSVTMKIGGSIISATALGKGEKAKLNGASATWL